MKLGFNGYYIELGLYNEGGIISGSYISYDEPPYSYTVTEKEEYYDVTAMTYEFDAEGYPVKLYCSAKSRTVRETTRTPLEGTQGDVQVETTYGEPETFYNHTD